MDKIKNNVPVVGVGAANAFPLTTPGTFLQNYSIMCIRKRKDIDLIKKDMEVFCLEEEDYKHSQVPRANPKELLNVDSAKEYVLSFGKPYIFARKTTPGVQKFCKLHNLKLVNSPKDIRDVYENKLFFRKTLESAGVKPIPGEVISYSKIDWIAVNELKKKYGNELVLQAAELVYGGGVGTAFIESEEDFDEYIARMERIKNNPEVPRRLENIIVTKFMKGTPTSILGVATKYGVITGSVQVQLQDIKDVCYLKKGSGIYCGHDWSYQKYSDSILQKAKNITQKFGEYIYSEGYRGIFGLDLIINKEENEVYPIECNPRYTDALPVISQLAQKKGLPTLEYYHFLEHMGIDYEVDVEKLSNEYLKSFEGSHILISSKYDGPTRNRGELEAGIYEYANDSLVFKKQSYNPADISNENEFLLTDGVPYKNTYFKRVARIMRVVFPSSVLAGEKELKPEISHLIELIYNKLDLTEINK